MPSVKPGYLRPLVPEEAPDKAEPWTAVMADIERVVMSGVTHWHSPRFHAYFPTAQSYPAIVADMLSGAIACIGFTWVSNMKAKLSDSKNQHYPMALQAKKLGPNAKLVFWVLTYFTV